MVRELGFADRISYLFRVSPRRSIKAAIVLAGRVGLGVASHAVGAADPKRAATEKKIDFTKDIQPILKESCIRCHKAPEARRGGGGCGGGGPGGGAGGGPGGGPGGPGGGPRGPAGVFRLDDKEEALKGGKHGAAIVPGKAEDSLLVKLLSAPTKVDDDELHAMPKPKPREEFKPLKDEKIKLIKLWIDQGANWPDKK